MEETELVEKIEACIKAGASWDFDFSGVNGELFGNTGEGSLDTYSVFINNVEIFFTDYMIYEETLDDDMFYYNRENDSIYAENCEKPHEKFIVFRINGGVNFVAKIRLNDIKTVDIMQLKVERD